MLELHLNDLLDADAADLARRIREAGGNLQVTLTVDDQYRSDSKWALAHGWLRTWYIAESLAEHASKPTCDFQEGERGAGEFEFKFSAVNAPAMTEKLVEFAAVFDPDELECGALMYDEAAEWLENRGEKPAKFPDLEEAYRADLAAAKEHAAEYGDDDDNDDY
jgi:hypothetical protein